MLTKLLCRDDRIKALVYGHNSMFFYRETVFCLSLNFVNIMPEIKLRFS